MSTMIGSGEATREEIAATLAEAVYHARREMPKVGTPEMPTPWDEAHELIDVLLDDLLAAEA